RTKEKLAFNVEIVSALKLYRAQNEGKGPPTHDDFMKDIIKANQIKLPQLRSGEEYWWDAEAEDGKGELMITQPEKE
ncbi:MAG: hypothetical protein LBT89_10925, partial [Planctomycetaceae bacterium]|nr:hypothetical protein [Planctomycetaceae bacterium]